MTQAHTGNHYAICITGQALTHGDSYRVANFCGKGRGAIGKIDTGAGGCAGFGAGNCAADCGDGFTASRNDSQGNGVTQGDATGCKVDSDRIWR